MERAKEMRAPLAKQEKKWSCESITETLRATTRSKYQVPGALHTTSYNLAKQAPIQQGMKRKQGDDDRPIDPALHQRCLLATFMVDE